jgi:hypothetical protein
VIIPPKIANGAREAANLLVGSKIKNTGINNPVNGHKSNKKPLEKTIVSVVFLLSIAANALEKSLPNLKYISYIIKIIEIPAQKK